MGLADGFTNVKNDWAWPIEGDCLTYFVSWQILAYQAVPTHKAKGRFDLFEGSSLPVSKNANDILEEHFEHVSEGRRKSNLGMQMQKK